MQGARDRSARKREWERMHKRIVVEWRGLVVAMEGGDHMEQRCVEQAQGVQGTGEGMRMMGLGDCGE